MSPRSVFRAAALASVAFGARTASTAPLVTLEYRVPEAAGGSGGACPSKQEFIDALSARGAALDSANAAERAQGLEVSVRYAGGAYVGELSVRSRTNGAASRVVHDAECSEVVSGLALTAAIALGGGAGVESDASASGPSGSETVLAGAALEGAAVESAAEPPSESDSARLRGTSFGQKDSIAVDAGELGLAGARSYTLTAGVHAGLIPGVLMPRFDLNASLASFLSLPGDGGTRLFGPLLQVHWAVLGPTTSRHAGVALNTWGLEGGINSCSALTYDTRGWNALVCAEFGAGWLFMESRASGAASGDDQAAGYGFGGLAFDAQYNFNSWAQLAVRAGGRLQTPLRAADPAGNELFESSVWAGYATVGVGIHF